MSNQDDDKRDDGNSIFWVAALIFCIATPVTILSAAVTYFAFTWQRIRLSTITWLALVPSIILLAIFFQPAVDLFSESWRVTIPSILNQEADLIPAILQVFLQQIPLAIPLGVAIGLIYSARKWHNRPKWENKELRSTIKEWFMKGRTLKQIKSDTNSPRDGMTLGVDQKGHRVVQTYEESEAHTLIMGASGSGKTTTMKSRLRDSLKSGQGALVIDLKGDPKFAYEVFQLSERYGHKFQHWLMQPEGVPYTGPAVDGPAYYDPIARGDATRRKDLIIESREWTEPYYKMESSSYLQILMNVLIGNPQEGVPTLSQVVRLLDPKALQERAIPLGSNPSYSEIVRSVDELNDERIPSEKKKVIDSLRAQFSELLMSVAGRYLKHDPTEKHNNIDLKRAAHNGDVVFFSLDSSNYGQMAGVVANLLIQDLKTVSSELRNDPIDRPFQVIIDEFQAAGSGNVIGLINKSRDAQMPVTLATQALGDLRNISDAFLDQLIGIVGSFIIHRPNKESDAQLFAGLTGTVSRARVSEGYSTGQTTGAGMIQQVEEYNIKPNEILNLRMGEMIYVNKFISPMKVIKVLCIPEDSSYARTATPAPIPVSAYGAKINDTPSGEKSLEHSEDPVSAIPTYDPSSYSSQSEEKNNHKSSESNDPNIGRLKEFFNQDPETLLSPEVKRHNEYTVKVMPPNVAQPLNLPSESLEPKKFPSLPPLPKPVIRPPLGKKDINNEADKPISNNKQKDEFDF